MSEDLPFRAEYAKSNRSSCKSCRETIVKDELRMAAMVQSPHFDGRVPNWYHFRCFFVKFKVKTEGDVGHFDSLRYEDQKRITDKLGGSGAGPSAGSSSAKGSKRKAVASPRSGTTDLGEFSTEYAKSNRSSCKGCKETIMKDTIRISKTDRESDTARRFGPSPAWYHWECFIQVRDQLEYFEDATKIPGFMTLGVDDQKKLKDKIKKIDAPKNTGDELDAKKLKVDSKEEIALKEQSQIIFRFRDWLQKNLKKKEMSELFDYNGQEIPKGESKMLDRLSDIMSFGCLEPCGECKGQLVFSNDGYHCVGDLTEWAKCQVITKTPKRSPFSVPEELKEEHSFLKSYKFKKRDRIFAVRAGPSQPKSELTTIRVKKPLDYAKIVFGGKIDGDKEALKKRILDLGGKVITKIDETVACVISCESEVKKMSKKMLEAKENGVHVVAAGFLDEIGNGDVSALIIKHSIASWGDSPQKRLGASAADGLKLASGKASGSFVNKSKSTKQKVTVKGGAAVDVESGKEHTAHVLMDQKTPYNAVLGKVDLQRGTNSFYKLQVLEADSGNHFWVFRSWGRVGTTIGGTKLEDHDTRLDAISQFKALYEEKSGNMWENREKFEKKANCFYPLDIDYGQSDEMVQKLMPGGNSKLHKSIQELICLIFDVDKMKKALIEFEVDLEKMPLGKLSRKQIEKAYSVLTEIQEIIKSGSNQAKLLDASTRFYTLIPHNFGMAKPPLLDSEEVIKLKIGMIESLLEIEVAYSLLKETGGNVDLDPIDQHYEQLKTTLEVMEKKSKEFEQLIQYITTTHAETHNMYQLEVEEIFKVNRQGEGKRYKPFKQLPNRQLLWHGSRTTNYAGILSTGLKIAPPEAPVTGYMFGKGIYFADMVSKSANYCYTNKSNSTGLLMLCEVALGNMHELTQAEMITKLPVTKHSTKGLGRTHPDPATKITTPDGVIIPIGSGVPAPVKNTSLLYNEYIVYDVAQVNIKYLLKVNFKWKY